MLKLESDPLLNARIRALYLYSTGQYKHRKDIANAVGYGRNAVGRWFQTYEESGLKGLLSYGKAGNPRPLGIPPSVMEALQVRLNEPKRGFSSFKEAWLWLKEEHGIELSYVWVNEILREKLNAGLKVPRKSNLKKDPDKESKFKKTSDTSSLSNPAPFSASEGVSECSSLGSILSG